MFSAAMSADFQSATCAAISPHFTSNVHIADSGKDA